MAEKIVSAVGEVFKEYMETRSQPKMSSTKNWLLSLSEDIDSLPPLKKARLKLKIQSTIVESMEENSSYEENKIVEEEEI